MTRRRTGAVLFSIFLFGVAAAITTPGQTFHTLASFDRTDGAIPSLMSPIQGTDGNFYGTTGNGGANNYGTVFKITPQGELTTLYSFCSLTNCIDGAFPMGGLLQAADGDFYGTVALGGDYGYGAVFRLTLDGTLTTLHSFDSRDGWNPESTLIQGSDGYLYGTTSGYYGNLLGTVFKVSPQGQFTNLHSFCSRTSCFDGKFPVGGLVQGFNGDFYGTTVEGGAHGDGTVFRITSEGTLTTLYSFDGVDGAGPYVTLVQTPDANLYGITVGGGTHDHGTVFKVTPQGNLTRLHSFCSAPYCPDGYFPSAGLVQANDGNFYGTANEGGTKDLGTIFKITPQGTLTTLHSFDFKGGGQPVGGLLQATNGNFYGATSIGGTYNDGVVFGLSVGLGTFVSTQPRFGNVGAGVIVLGNNFTGATSVTFNGTAATFHVVSDTEIMTTVPQGATTGVVEVTTSGGLLQSNVTFRVTR